MALNETPGAKGLQNNPAVQKTDDVGYRILRISKELFETHGYSGVSTDQIAKMAAISKRTLYELFPSKISLLKSIFLIGVRNIRLQSRDLAFDDPKIFTEQLKHFLTVFRNESLCFCSALLLDLHRESPLMTQRIRAWKTAYLKFAVGRIIERGQLSGAIRADIDAKVLTAIVMVSVAVICKDGSQINTEFQPDPNKVIALLVYGFVKR